MKIALITIHWANNYGAALQTFATCEALKKYGDVSVIDYRSKMPAKGMQLLRCGSTPRDVLRMGKDIFRLFPRARVIRKFAKFNFRYFNMTSRIKSQDDFDDLVERYDIFISGSDQIWNPSIVNDHGQMDGRYFLDFAVGKKRVSYASSIGSYQYSSEERQDVFRYLNEYTELSVREENSAAYLTDLTEREVRAVVDPVLLLTRQQWEEKFPARAHSAPYILVYALKKDHLLKRIVEKAAKQLGMPVIAIDQDPFLNYSADQHVKDASPEEFIGLFHSATFVVTNSFHGLCFSLNLEKSFIATTPLTGINRLQNLLGHAELESRLVQEDTQEEDITQLISNDVDYDLVTPRLDEVRAKSLAYLEEAVAGD